MWEDSPVKIQISFVPHIFYLGANEEEIHFSLYIVGTLRAASVAFVIIFLLKRASRVGRASRAKLIYEPTGG